MSNQEGTIHKVKKSFSPPLPSLFKEMRCFSVVEWLSTDDFLVWSKTRLHEVQNNLPPLTWVHDVNSKCLCCAQTWHAALLLLLLFLLIRKRSIVTRLGTRKGTMKWKWKLDSKLDNQSYLLLEWNSFVRLGWEEAEEALEAGRGKRRKKWLKLRWKIKK